MSQDPLTPTLTTFRKRIVREARLKIRTLQPAKIIAYDDVTSTATIELAHQLVEKGRDGNTEIARPAFELRNVPVIQLGGQDAYLRLPIAVGSTGLALISDRCIAAWRVDGDAHPPPMPHTHGLGDAIFLAGVRADSNPLPPATMGGALLEAPTIQLGTGATPDLGAARVTDPTIAAAGMIAFMTAISTAFAALGAIPVNLPAQAACSAVGAAQATAQADFGTIFSGSLKTFVE